MNVSRLDKFEASDRGAIKRFIELAHSGPYDMLLPVAAAWDEMEQDFAGGEPYTIGDFVDAGKWAAQDISVTLPMVLVLAGTIEKAQDKSTHRYPVSEIAHILEAIGTVPSLARVLASGVVGVAEEAGRVSNAGQN